MTAGQGFLDWMKNASVAGGLIRGSRRLGSRAFGLGMGMMAGDPMVRAAAFGGFRGGLGRMAGPALIGMGIGMGTNVALNTIGNARRGDPLFAGTGGALVRGGMAGAMLGGGGFAMNRLARANSGFMANIAAGSPAFAAHMQAMGPMLGRFGMGI